MLDWLINYIIYVIGQLGGPYSEKLWLRSWKCCPRPQADTNISSPRSQFFTVRTNPKVDNNMFIFFSRDKLPYKWVCLRNFVIESAYAPSKNHLCKKI